MSIPPGNQHRPHDERRDAADSRDARDARDAADASDVTGTHEAFDDDAADDESTTAQSDHAIQRMIDENRVLTGSRMIPSAGPLMDGHHQSVRDALEAFLADTNTPLAQVAAGTRYSDTTLSEWRSGKYAGNCDKLTRAVNRWLERESQRRAAIRPNDYVATEVAEAMYFIIDEADRRNCMAAIVAPSGTGKSMILKDAAESMRGAYIDCRETLSGRTFIRKMIIAIGGQPRSGITRDDLLTYLITFVKGKPGRRPPIFLDEAQNLTPELISIVRTVHDLAEVPIIMAGTAAIFTATNDRADGGGQFASRCLYFDVSSHLQRAKRGRPNGGGAQGQAGERVPTFKLDEVKRFLDMKRMRVTPEALDLIWKLACLDGFGGLRFARELANGKLDEVISPRRVWHHLEGFYSYHIDTLRSSLDQFERTLPAELPRAIVA